MVSRKLMGVWTALDLLLVVAGAVTLALSIVWRAPNLMLNMVLSPSDLTAGTLLGIAFLLTFAVSVGAIIQRNHVTIGLVILNWVLIADAIAVIIIGSFMWFYTLQERNNYHKFWVGTSRQNRLDLQDKLQCCGYFNSTDFPEVGGTFCQTQDIITNLSPNVTSNFCVTPITHYADVTLNNVFSTIYGYMAIIICLLLASLCVIKKRQEDERFKKIDAKRGGRGFV